MLFENADLILNVLALMVLFAVQKYIQWQINRQVMIRMPDLLLVLCCVVFSRGLAFIRFFISS